LQNVRRRLEICYGSAAELTMEQDAARTTVEFSIPIPAVA
jgi:LytS/YehU family sensor histidine kinase